MKLLLTSAWFMNQSIVDSLSKMLTKPISESNIVVIPTAFNVEVWDKTWYINDLVNIKKLGFKNIEIVDISAVDKKIWLEVFKNSDILYFEWGSTFYLQEQIKKSGLDKELQNLLKEKVFVWVSAWSIITNPKIILTASSILYDEEVLENKQDISWLWFVDFYILPHLNNTFFPKMIEKNVREILKDLKEKIYVLDDNSAIEVCNWEVKVVSEWEYFILNN